MLPQLSRQSASLVRMRSPVQIWLRAPVRLVVSDILLKPKRAIGNKYIGSQSSCKCSNLCKRSGVGAAGLVEIQGLSHYMQVWCQWLARDLAKVEARVRIPLLAPGYLIRKVSSRSQICGGVQAKPANEVKLFGTQYYRAKSSHHLCGIGVNGSISAFQADGASSSLVSRSNISDS